MTKSINNTSIVSKMPYVSLVFTCLLVACGGGSDESNLNLDSRQPSPVLSDTNPDTFVFQSINSAKLNTQIQSNIVTVSGINTVTPVSIEAGEYSINNGEFTSANGQINNGDTIRVRLISSREYLSQTTTTLSIGEKSASFTVTTELQPTTVTLFMDHGYNIGGVSEFERSKYITIHASHTENDWYEVGENASDDLITEFVETYDVYFGRDTGSMAWQLGLMREHPSKPGFIDTEFAKTLGSEFKRNYTTSTTPRAITQRRHESRNIDMIVAAQQHPYWPDGQLTRNGWALSTTDNANEPFGTATGQYMGRYLLEYFKQKEQEPYGQPKPLYIEVMNEPLYELVTVADEPEQLTKIFEFHNTVAEQIRSATINGDALNSSVQIGGYTAAFPDFEKQNFNRWRQRDKAFIDIAGENMDFLSIHLYDFPIFGQKEIYRSGANNEATFDMLETYSMLKLNKVLPFVISEFGAQVHNLNNEPWSEAKDWLNIRSVNSMMFNFLNRPHLIEKVIPFITVKAEWGRISDTVPYPTRLMRQQFEKDGDSGAQWVYTEQLKLYELWQNVSGKRLFTAGNDLDIQHLAFSKDNKVYLMLNNLELENDVVQLAVEGINNNQIVAVTTKHLYAEQNIPFLETQTYSALPTQVTIGAMSTMLVEIELRDELAPTQQTIEKKYYATSYLKEIRQDTDINFEINNVETSDFSSAVLRVSLGRNHDLSLQPRITINGESISFSEDYRGVEQALNGRGRESFYGSLEIPVDSRLLNTNNVITLSFPDSSGYVATLTLLYASNSPIGN